MNLRNEIDRMIDEGYNEANAEARLCQDVILKAISESSLRTNITIKGGVVMRNLSGSVRRATQDIDLDFIRYSISDESIHAFISRLNHVEGISIRLISPMKELNHQDYTGKRVFVDIVDEFDYHIEGKIDICFQEDGASLLMNSKEQIITEKIKSLLRFGIRNTRYKDVFDIYFLKETADSKKLSACMKRYIFDDDTLNVGSISDVVDRLERIFTNQTYIREINRSKKNWF